MIGPPNGEYVQTEEFDDGTWQAALWTGLSYEVLATTRRDVERMIRLCIEVAQEDAKQE